MSTSRSDEAGARTVVVALGNTLMGDDGLGIAALERLQRQWRVPSEVELVDGGTAGMSLLPIIEGAARVLLLDAIDARADPGTFLFIARDRLPRYLATKISPHQIDLADVLALAELRGTLPEEALAMGLQPAEIRMSTDLSDPVSRGLDKLVDEVVRLLERWGYRCVRADDVAIRSAHESTDAFMEETA
jgi:hydrogenase maturation protease